jgi:GTP-binding protein
MKNKCHGKDGSDLVLRVAPGTQIVDKHTGHLLADMKNVGDRYIVATGGRGGLGNCHFKSAINQTPREFKPGEPAICKTLMLELKLIADVGIIGLPNAGKSTFISAVSNAKPKVAEYPFTTLEPVLGVAKYDDKMITFCDIPGLIEGASTGRGLGHDFLKHSQRAKILLHLVDATSDDPQKDYETIRKELEDFDEDLAKKREIVVLTKIDLIDKLPKKFKYDFAISSATGKGVSELLGYIAQEK